MFRSSARENGKSKRSIANGDGRTQVLFTGIHKKVRNKVRRCDWYSTIHGLRQAFGLRVEADYLTGRVRRMHWSSNSPQADAGYRVAMRDKARALLSVTTRT